MEVISFTKTKLPYGWVDYVCNSEMILFYQNHCFNSKIIHSKTQFIKK